MSDNDKLQEELEEALEHDADHPVNKEEYEIPEDVLLGMHLKQLQDKFRRSQVAFENYMAEQDKIWGKL